MILENITFCGNGENSVFLPKNPVLESVSAYSSAYHMLSEELDISAISADFRDFLVDFDIFDGLTYYVFNGELVVVTDGYNVCGVETLDSVLPNLEDYYKREWCENETD